MNLSVKRKLILVAVSALALLCFVGVLTIASPAAISVAREGYVFDVNIKAVADTIGTTLSGDGISNFEITYNIEDFVGADEGITAGIAALELHFDYDSDKFDITEITGLNSFSDGTATNIEGIEGDKRAFIWDGVPNNSAVGGVVKIKVVVRLGTDMGNYSFGLTVDSRAYFINDENPATLGEIYIASTDAIVAVSAKPVVTVTADSANKIYDGTALTCDTFTTSSIPAGYTVEAAMTADSTVTNVAEGNVANKVDPDTVIIKNTAGEDVSAAFNVNVVDGTLSIGKRAVTIAWKTTDDKNGENYSDAFVYNLLEQSVYPFITNLIANDTCVLTVVGNKGANANNYSASITAVGNDNYTIIGGDGLALSWAIRAAKLDAPVIVGYRNGIVTWTAVTTAEGGITVPDAVTVLYKVSGTAVSGTSFVADKASSSFSITADASNVNFSLSNATDTKAAYTVTFTAEHGTAPAKQFIFANEKVAQPADLDCVGYEFGGWYKTEADTAWAFDTDIVTSATEIVGRMTACVYEIIYRDSDNVILILGAKLDTTAYSGKTEYTFDTGLVLPSVKPYEKTGYTFIGWYDAATDGAKVTEVAATSTDTVTVYARWHINEYSITYRGNFDGGVFTDIGTPVVYEYGADVTAAAYPQPAEMYYNDYYTFIGWFSDENLTIKYQFGTMPAENVSLYGGFVWDIGTGDVNADGVVDTDDIMLYRMWLIGGWQTEIAAAVPYKFAVGVAPVANTFAEIVLRAADVNADGATDIRDVSALRMAIVGGYGGVILDGVNVSGQSVSFTMAASVTDEQTEYYETVADAIDNANGNTVTLIQDVELTETLVVNDAVTLDLNGCDITFDDVDAAFDVSGDLSITDGAYADGCISIPDTAALHIGEGGFTADGGRYNVPLKDTDYGSDLKQCVYGDSADAFELTDTITAASVGDYTIVTGDAFTVYCRTEQEAESVVAKYGGSVG